MKAIYLSDQEYQTLLTELQSLHSYHWNDKSIHADDCGSKIQLTIEQRAHTIHNDEAYRHWMENEFVSFDSEIDLAAECCSAFNMWEPDGSAHKHIMELAKEVFREMEP